MRSSKAISLQERVYRLLAFCVKEDRGWPLISLLVGLGTKLGLVNILQQSR